MKEQAQHTPGPWTTWQNNNGYWRILGGRDGSLPITETGDVSATPACECQIQEANARLIAAAPELLEAAKILYKLIDKRASEERQLEALKDLKEAIAKAEGRTNV